MPAVVRLSFTGDGAEYFRIWVANLLLTLVTLGVYSAWAKVRKTRYFWQNTQLDGHVFDYHGNPVAILRGRLFALALAAVYTLSSELSVTAGALAVLAVLLAGPWLFLRANQFRLRNTSWRGLRFDFRASPREAYRSLTPLLIIWFSGTLAGLLTPDVAIAFGIVGAATPLLMPWMHHRLKRFQHSHAAYGDVHATFRPSVGRFFAVYFKCGLLALLVAIPVGLLAAGLGYGAAWLLARAGMEERSGIAPVVVGVSMLLVFYVAMWPYYATRIQQVVWAATSLGPATFRTHVEAMPLARIALRSSLLTLMTCGLYWPFAAVAIARYRVGCMEVTTAAPITTISGQITATRASAAGDGAADVFGLDVGL